MAHAQNAVDGKEHGNYYIVCQGDIGTMEKKMDENGNYYIVYWGDLGIMEKNMETTIWYIRVI